MRLRIPGAVDSPLTARPSEQIHAWVRTTGGASQVIDTQAGVLSITDAGVGLLDVTWEVPFAAGNSYAPYAAVEVSDVSQTVCKIQPGTPPTATALRVVCVNASTLAEVDPTSGGYFVMACGF